MVFHRVMDSVFATWSHVAALRTLQDSAQGLSGREIARLSGMNHRSCLKALTTLEELGIVIRQRGGRDHLFSLNRDHMLVEQGIAPLLTLERMVIRDFADFLSRQLGKLAESIILFGSVARKEETPVSDVDICVIVRTRLEKDKAQSIIHDIAGKVQKRYGARISPLLLTLREFSSKARREEPPIREIIKEGVILRGRSIKELSNAAQ
jgi:predicted nucleotidyltransferase